MASERGPRRNGFTLLEMLVALAVFSLAALAIIRLQAYAINAAAEIDTQTGARLVAENLAAEILSDPFPPNIGEEEGRVDNLGRSWTWQQTVAFTEDRRILRIDIRVQSDLGGSPALLTLIRSAE